MGEQELAQAVAELYRVFARYPVAELSRRYADGVQTRIARDE